MYDVAGDGFALLRLDPAIDAGALTTAAQARGIPLVLLDIAPADAGDVYSSKLVLSRPDQHVAWRGDALPADACALLDLVCGHNRNS